jgi:L-asparaginase II
VQRERLAVHRLPPSEHPLQQRIRELIAGGTAAVDGCGVPTFALPLTEIAGTLTRVPSRIREAMSARPELVGGSVDAVDTDLMRLRPGWIAKGGAEGLLCASSPDGRGVALKAEDGGYRAIGPALGRFLGIEELERVPVTNSRGEVVGEMLSV